MIFPMLNLAVVPIELLKDRTLTPQDVVICLHLLMHTFAPTEADSNKDMAAYLGLSEEDFYDRCHSLQVKYFLRGDELAERMVDLANTTLELGEIF